MESSMEPANDVSLDADSESFASSHVDTAANVAKSGQFTYRHLILFLTLHLLAFSAMIFAMVFFLLTKDYLFFCWILLPFLFSGVFCTHAAWHCNTTSLKCCLPLRGLRRVFACILAIPLGLGQGIIVLLALDDFRSRTKQSSGSPHKQVANKFHMKAVNGMFEGFPASAVLLYCYWTAGFPQDNPITRRHQHEDVFLAIVGIIAFAQSGVGLLELDFCVSKTISKRMRRSLLYEFMHCIFRVSEVASRVSIFIAFMVTTRCRLSWWWVPLAAEFCATGILVAVYGGAEKTWLVRMLCSVPCSFANVFLFIDSPYKRRAASRLSRCLTIKNGLEMVLLPTIAVLALGADKDGWSDLREWVSMHVPTVAIAATSVPMYWFLLWWIHSPMVHTNTFVDIFSACEGGSVSAVRQTMRHLTKSAAVGFNVNCFDVEGHTPLMFAARSGNKEVCLLLLKEGARVGIAMFRKSNCSLRSLLSISARRRWTALHMAASKGHAEVVRALLEHRNQEDCTFLDALDDTPLHVAAWSGHEEVVRLLAVAHPRWSEEVNKQGKTPLQLARNEAVKQAILAPTVGGEDGGRAALLLQSAPLGVREMKDQIWPQVQLAISRNDNAEDLSAPGLCSYIASSCGGALARSFLSSATSAGVPRLPSISEVSEIDSLSIAEQTQALPSVSASIHAATDTPPVLQNPLMEDLEPISADGTAVSPAFLRPPSRIGSRPASRSSIEGPSSRCASCWLSRSRSTSQAALGDQVGDPYQAERFKLVPEEAVLGQGAYGLVWRAMDRRTRTWYAVKNIQTFRRGAAEIARRECEVADRVRFMPHPCLVHLFHVHHFSEAALYCLVMEFCPGGELLGSIRSHRRQCAREGRNYTAPRQALPWLGQVFLGLEHMHLRMDTLMRDLKPENCVLTSTGRVKLTDFGFGRFGVESSGRWSFGIPTGSPGYVAPEILQKLEYDSRVDLYSFGVLVWVMLTGGVTNINEPVPPLGRMRRAMDFDAHLQDWLLLAQCVTAPEKHNALRLPEDPRTFVLRLTHQKPDMRPRHPQIRLDPFMAPLRLPAFDDPPQAVESWLRGIENPAVAA